MYQFQGFARADGSVGVRNHVVVLPSVVCVNNVVEAIGRAVPGVVPLTHGHGCGRAGRDLEIHIRTLANLGRNPNVAAVLVVGLGCEVIMGEHLAQAIASSGKPVEFLCVQQAGGSLRSAAKGAEIARRLLAEAVSKERRPFGLDGFRLALNCGGSDAFSGVTANPAVGVVADWVVANGGTVLLTETTEMIGTGHILGARACCPELGREIEAMVERQEHLAEDVLGPIAKALISPGNMDGGMSSIREKSLGCIVKGGTSAINAVVAYAEVPKAKGLVIMDGPGYDAESLTGEVASGAQAVIFTTGRGTPIGFPIAPVIKVASNSGLYDRMTDDMDFNAGRILEGAPLQRVGEDLIARLKAVIDGEPTKAERNGVPSFIYPWTTNTSF